MSKKLNPEKGEYSYPELLERYFPGDAYEIEDESDSEETTQTRQSFFDFLKQVSKPLQPKADTEMSQ